jgi:arylsulfatase A-like enzyme
MTWLSRLLFAVLGANGAALLVAAIEARGLGEEGSHAESLELVLDVAGVLAPLAWAMGVLTFAFAALLEPERSRSPGEHLAALRALPVLARSRVSAMLPLSALALVGALVVSAHASKGLLSEGAPAAQGAALALTSVALLLAFFVVAIALSSPLRRLLARAGGKHPILVDPGATASAGVALAGGMVVLGAMLGDASGEGPTPLAILGVLRRKELDLAPLSHLLLLAFGAYVALIVHARATRLAPMRAPLLLAVIVGTLVLPALCGRAAQAMNRHDGEARAIERHAAAGKIAVRLLRRATDRDKDGTSALFGGLDCDDHDALRAPDKWDVPGNGVDEDCSGADTPPPPAPKKIEEPKPAKPARSYNVLLITIDTLRADVGFLGYPKPITPNLDELAKSSTVYEHAYAMASYTGKSIGPMLIGKYPSETVRDGSHFNKYEPENVLVTERLHDAGFYTFGCAAHWYWKPWSGVTQGMDNFDLSPIPPGMGDNDNSVGGDRVTYVAKRMLAAEEEREKSGDAGTGRFFMWIHYFDPHAQYVPHDGSPDFRGEDRGPAAETRAAYDNEVWFTDKMIGGVLEALHASSFAKDTAIIVTADHGEAFGEHNMTWHGVELYEMLTHVPLLVYVPGEAGQRIKEKRSHIDLVPTILDLANVPRPDDPNALHGHSLLDDIRRAPGAEPEERDVYMDMPAGPWNETRHALITGPAPGMKLIHIRGNLYSLYDLAADPTEKNDLASDKDKVRELADRMNQIRAGLKEIDVKPDSP